MCGPSHATSEGGEEVGLNPIDSQKFQVLLNALDISLRANYVNMELTPYLECKIKCSEWFGLRNFMLSSERCGHLDFNPPQPL